MSVKIKINMLFVIMLLSCKCVLCLFHQLAEGGAQPWCKLGRTQTCAVGEIVMNLKICVSLLWCQYFISYDWNCGEK